MTTIPVRGLPQRAAVRPTGQPAVPRPRYEGLFLEPLYTVEVDFPDDVDSVADQAPARVQSRSRR
jgi:hypothetical protein